MAIAIFVGRDEEESHQYHWFIDAWKEALLKLDSNLDIRIWPDVGNHEEIELALVWRHPFSVLKQFSKLKAIMSLAAGVDHVFADHELSKTIPILRVMDPYMANDIVQYVLVCVLNYIKRMEAWAAYQKQKRWMKVPPFNFSDKTVGIMGLGFLGEKAARALLQCGINVIGWRYSKKPLAGINTFNGDEEFADFLAQIDILVCMLPLTLKTQDILNQDTFMKLRKGAYIINLGRGEQLVEKDLINALDSDQLSGACLDVFRQEPLPVDHPFWIHPKIRVTPHIASVTNPITAAPQVLENYKRALAGKELLNRVDWEKGY